MTITPAECRGARAVLHWSQAELARASKTAPRTVALFEEEKRTPHPRTLQDIQDALIQAGVRFFEHEGSFGIRVQDPLLKDTVSATQCRVARALVDITQGELAAVAGVGLSTVVDFEKSRREVSKEAIRAIQIALENAGIQFFVKSGGGSGVGLRK